MTADALIARRGLLFGAACLALPAWGARAEALPEVVVTKDPSCGCCSAWMEHLGAAGFPVRANDGVAPNQMKAKLGVPRDLASCHTAEVAGYAIEGHVPAHAIRRVLAERPSARGLAVPGMPVGSPGMEVEGTPPEVFQVILFGPAGRRVFGTYKGALPA